MSCRRSLHYPCIKNGLFVASHYIFLRDEIREGWIKAATGTKGHCSTCTPITCRQDFYVQLLNCIPQLKMEMNFIPSRGKNNNLNGNKNKKGRNVRKALCVCTSKVMAIFMVNLHRWYTSFYSSEFAQ